MLVSFYKGNSIQSAVFLPFVAAGLWIFAFLNPIAVEGRHLMPLYELIVYWLGDLPQIAFAVSIAVLVTSAFLLNAFVSRHEVLNTNSYMVALLYVLLMSSCPPLLTMHPVIFANLFLILALNRIMGTYRREKAYFEVFDAGIFISLATLFYFPAFVFFPLIWVGLILIRPFIWREWIIALIGFFVPYLFTWAYYFWYGITDYLWYDKMFYPLSARYVDLNLPGSFYFLIGMLMLICLLGFGKLFKGLTLNSIRSKNNAWLLIWMLGLSVVSFLIAPTVSIKYLSFAAVPIAVQAANYFLSSRKPWFAEAVFYLLVASIVANEVLNFPS